VPLTRHESWRPKFEGCSLRSHPRYLPTPLRGDV